MKFTSFITSSNILYDRDIVFFPRDEYTFSPKKINPLFLLWVVGYSTFVGVVVSILLTGNLNCLNICVGVSFVTILWKNLTVNFAIT